MFAALGRSADSTVASRTLEHDSDNYIKKKLSKLDKKKFNEKKYDRQTGPTFKSV